MVTHYDYKLALILFLCFSNNTHQVKPPLDPFLNSSLLFLLWARVTQGILKHPPRKDICRKGNNNLILNLGHYVRLCYFVQNVGKLPLQESDYFSYFPLGTCTNTFAPNVALLQDRKLITTKTIHLLSFHSLLTSAFLRRNNIFT